MVSGALDEAIEAWSNLALTDDIRWAGLQFLDATLQGEFQIAIHTHVLKGNAGAAESLGFLPRTNLLHSSLC